MSVQPDVVLNIQYPSVLYIRDIVTTDNKLTCHASICCCK